MLGSISLALPRAFLDCRLSAGLLTSLSHDRLSARKILLQSNVTKKTTRPAAIVLLAQMLSYSY